MSASDKHYSFDYKGIRIDPYRLFKIYGITDPCQQHAIKKLLRAGQSVKSLAQDIDEVILTLQRWKGMLEEDYIPAPLPPLNQTEGLCFPNHPIYPFYPHPLRMDGPLTIGDSTSGSDFLVRYNNTSVTEQQWPAEVASCNDGEPL